jgi:hypothetical protein
MSVEVDRFARLHELVGSDGKPDLAEALLWPALAALSVPGSSVPTRRCVASYLRLAADVLALDDATTGEGTQWRAVVVALATAYREATDLLAQVHDDRDQQPLVPVLRQMLGVCEQVADWLDRPDASAGAPQTPDDALPRPREVAAGHRRRPPWFGADIDGGKLWSGDASR